MWGTAEGEACGLCPLLCIFLQQSVERFFDISALLIGACIVGYILRETRIDIAKK